MLFIWKGFSELKTTKPGRSWIFLTCGSEKVDECYMRSEARPLWSSLWLPPQDRHIILPQSLCRRHRVNMHRDDLTPYKWYMLLVVKITDNLHSEVWSQLCPHKADEWKNIAAHPSKTNMRVHQRTKMWLRSQSLDSICECCHCCTRLNQKFGG